MRGKIIMIVVVLLVLVGIAAGVDHFFKIKDNKLVLKVEYQGNTHGAVATRKAEIESVKAEYESFKQARGSFGSLNQANTTLTQEVSRLEAEKTSLQDQFIKAVEEKRRISAGVVVPEVQLVSGTVLKDVNFKSFGDEEVSLVHAGGVIRIPGTDLPPAINERMRYGMFPMLLKTAAKPASADATAAMLAKAAEVDARPKSKAELAAEASAAQEKERAERKLRIAKLQGQLVELNSQVTALRDTQGTWKRRSQELRWQASELQGRGRPVSVIAGQIAESDQSAASFDSRIANLKEEEASVRKRLAEEQALRR